MLDVKTKKIRDKSEDFIGWVSPDSQLKVIGLADRVGRNGTKFYKVTCKICSSDTELFPDGFFCCYKI